MNNNELVLQNVLQRLQGILVQIPNAVVSAVREEVIAATRNINKDVQSLLIDEKYWIAAEEQVDYECIERARKMAAENFRKMGGHVSSDPRRLYRALTNDEFAKIWRKPNGRLEYKFTLKRGNVYYGDIVNKVSSIVIIPRYKKRLKFTSYRDYSLAKTKGKSKFAKAVLWWSNAKGYMDFAFDYYNRPDVREKVKMELYEQYKTGKLALPHNIK